MTVFTQSNTAIQMNVRPSFMITDILAASVNSGSRNMINNNHLDVVAKNDIRVPPTIMPHEYDSDNEFADDADGSDICSNGKFSFLLNFNCSVSEYGLPAFLMLNKTFI